MGIFSVEYSNLGNNSREGVRVRTYSFTSPMAEWEWIEPREVALIDTLLNLMFRCGHRRLTRPVTPVHKGETPHGGTYVVCLDCGKQFSYDPKEMRLGKAIEPSTETSVAPTGNTPSSGSRLKRALVAAVPAMMVFFFALFGVKRDRQHR